MADGKRISEEVVQVKWVALCRSGKVEIDVGRCLVAAVRESWRAQATEIRGAKSQMPVVGGRQMINVTHMATTWADYEWLNTVVECTILRVPPKPRPDVQSAVRLKADDLDDALESEESLVSRYDRVPMR